MSNKFAAIPDIGNTIDSIRDACGAMKQMLETLTQQRGAVNKPAGAVTFQDLTSMGIITKNYVSASGSKYFVTPLDFGAIGNGATDDTIALQHAIADPRPLYLPGTKTFLFTSDIIYEGTSPKIIFGDGTSSSNLIMGNATQNGIVKNSQAALIVKNICITTNVLKTAGDAIKINGSGGVQSFQDTISSVRIAGTFSKPLFNGVNIVQGVIPQISKSYFLNCANTAITLQDTVGTFAGGEAVVDDNTFDSSLGAGNGSIAILILSGAGTTMIANNRIQHFDWGVLLSLADPPAVTVGSLIISNNAFESQNAGYAIGLAANGAAAMQSVTITGNRILANNSGLAIGNFTNSAWVAFQNIVGNTIEYTTANAINIEGGSYLNISDNMFTTGSNIAAVTLHPSWPNGNIFIGPNNYVGTSAPFAFNGNTNVRFARYPFEYALVTPVTGATIVFPEYTNTYLIAPAGALAALTVTFPAHPTDGAAIELSSTQSITTFTTQIAGGSGQTILGGFAGSFTANSSARWKYQGAGATWYRI